MKKFDNFVQLNNRRELDGRYAPVLQKKFMATPEFIKRLGLYGELDGHAGCVNCLEWSEDGTILASGSDDVHICLWDPFRKKQLASIATGHHGNVFTVKFIPNTGNRTLVSGAADNSVRIHDAVAKDIIGICTCHTNRVKRCATDPVSPSLFWSAGEDGVVIQHDLRTSHTCPTSDVKNNRNILIDLRKYIGGKAEAKCLAINPVRTDHIAVGANDPYVRIYDRRMIKAIESEGPSFEWEMGEGAVQYFVPGHLPSKITEYKRKYRSLAATYLTFNPEGNEILVNLGGEQIYLFPLVENIKTHTKCFSMPENPDSFVLPQVKDHHTNGYSNGYKNGTTVESSVANDFQIFRGMRPIKKPKEKVSLPPYVDAIKGKANEAFDARKYIKAVNLYNEALNLCPQSHILYGNRAAALLKRAWDGDVYAALKDCQTALFLDPEHFKALLRLGRCLFELKRFNEASACLGQFKTRFPDHSQTAVCKLLDEDLSRALAAEVVAASQQALKNAKKPSSNSNDSPSTSGSSSSGQQSTAAAFLRRSGDYVLRFRRSSGEGDGHPINESANNDEDEDSSADNEGLSVADSNRTQSSDSNSSSPVADSNVSKGKKPDLHEYESTFREKAVDFSERYCGHCNTTTDIKEANFFGGYIVAGSDDGSFIIWDRKTTNIVKIVKGDESIVNCLQPHPSTCMLATSGIESVVRLWSPMPEEGFVNDRVVKDVNNAAFENQKRMKSNPFEVILMNMGYRISGAEDEASDENVPREVPMPCNPS